MRGAARFISARDQSGFTLLEVMAALAITGLSILLVLQLFSGGLVSAKASKDYTDSAFHVREKISELLSDEDLDEGINSGATEDGFEWTTEVSRYKTKLDEENPDLKILKITVKIRNPEGRKEFSLETLKTVLKQES